MTSPSLPSEYQVIRSVVVSAVAGPPNTVAASRDSAKDVRTGVTARMVESPLRSREPDRGLCEIGAGSVLGRILSADVSF